MIIQICLVIKENVTCSIQISIKTPFPFRFINSTFSHVAHFMDLRLQRDEYHPVFLFPAWLDVKQQVLICSGPVPSLWREPRIKPQYIAVTIDPRRRNRCQHHHYITALTIIRMLVLIDLHYMHTRASVSGVSQRVIHSCIMLLPTVDWWISAERKSPVDTASCRRGCCLFGEGVILFQNPFQRGRKPPWEKYAWDKTQFLWKQKMSDRGVGGGSEG